MGTGGLDDSAGSGATPHGLSAAGQGRPRGGVSVPVGGINDRVPRPASPAPDPAADADVREVLGLLWRANHALEMLSKRMIRTIGVTGPQRMVLRIVAANTGISAGAIAEAGRIHPSTLTGILERLVARGFLSRARDRDDARRAQLAVTPRGQQAADARTGTVEAAMIRSLAALSPDDRAAVRRWLEAFASALEAEREGR